ncbi:MAG TPA: aminotransferase class I/II-fold pyridoxal phosphate-dependent enzyme, partial [Beijerinckiaceae bacterium]|nr:aminotransferase class I/II-fold pyridoxal phosphate-dependent enzyme [Beijerinckiaceae bacterium]
VEDGVYDFLSDEKISPIASLLPERTFYMTSLSKCVAAGLRAGCIVAPDAYVERLASSIRRMMWMTPPLGLEVATRWIREGVLEQLLSQQTEEFTERRRMAEVAFDKLKFTAPKAAAFIWLQLSQGVTSSELIAVAERNGVTLAPTDAFSVRKNRSKDFLRVSLSACRTPEELSHALNIVAKAADGSLISDIGYY